MKWVLILGLAVLGCNGAPPTAPGGGVPIPPGGGAGGIGGGGGAWGDGGHGGGALGACDNESDLDEIEGTDGSLRDIARECGQPSGPPSTCPAQIGDSQRYEDCISGCVEDQVPGLSAECASCYGALERCGLDASCRDRCWSDNCSTLCLECLHGVTTLNGVNCLEEYEDCRGLPGDGCPG